MIEFYQSKKFTDVHIEPTNACNFNCWMCPRSVMDRKIGYMDFDNFKKLVDIIRDSHLLKHIHFGGFGEPTLHKNIIEMIEYIKHNTKLTTSMTTNAWRFKDIKFSKRLLQSGLDVLFISLRHTKKQKIEDSIPATIKFEDYIDSLFDFINLHQKLYNILDLNISLLKESFYAKYILNIKQDEYLDYDFLNYFIKRIAEILNKDLSTYSEFTTSLNSKITRINVIRVSKNFNIRFDGLGAWTTAVEKYKDESNCYLSNYGTCTGLENHFSISWNGDVISCCGDFKAANKFGNIFVTNDLLKILSDKKTIKFAEALRNNKMPSKMCRICRGGLTKKEKYGNIIGTFIASKMGLFMRKKNADS